MPHPPQISEAEWSVMEVLWKQSPLASEDIIKALSEKSWASNTIRTLTARLVKKGALSFQKDGKRYLYSAVVLRDDCVCEELDSLTDRLFKGAVSPLVLHFVRSKKLSKADLAELRNILDGKKEK